MPANIRHILLLQRDISRAARFYNEGIGLRLRVFTERWAELEAGQGTIIALKAVEGEAQCTVGYSPFLSFNVDDLQGALTRCLEMGAVMDGPVQYAVQGKAAVIRAPDGQMIGLMEPEKPS